MHKALALGFLVSMGSRIGAASDMCPIRIAVSADGTYFDITHNGSYKRSSRGLEKELHGGSYNDANPSPVTSVILEIAPRAPHDRVNSLYGVIGTKRLAPGKG